jgi:hypothetical protein
MTLDRLLPLLLLIPSKQWARLFAVPFVPWLAAFSIHFLVTWFRPTERVVTKAVTSILLMFLFTASTVVQLW